MRVLVGMSGGIDSTAVCKLLLEQGYEVIGFTFITCDATETSAHEAAQLAHRLGIEHHIADIRKEFHASVVMPFVQAYLSGTTPNPCVNCNPQVKFRLLQEWADKLGCDKIATGHYVKKYFSNGKYYLVSGDDERKDQSYFLWRLTQSQLQRVIFPLGEWEKGDVRSYLKNNNLEKTADSDESMEICFIQGDYRDFIMKNLPDGNEPMREGSFVDSEGRVLGRHKGCSLYTIGQRKGLGVALGYPAYVIKINPEKNTVMLGREEQLKTMHMLIDAPMWVDTMPVENLSVRIRYRSKPLPCEPPRLLPDGRYLVRFMQQASAVTPGQSAVFYVENKVVGGAVISSQRGINQWITTNE